MNKKRKPEKPEKEEGEEMPELKPIPIAPMTLPDLLTHLEELVKFALECEKKELKEDTSFVNIYKQLLDIRKAIDVLNKDQQSTLSSIESITQTVGRKEISLSKEDQKMFDKIQHLKEVCETAKDRLHASIQQQPEAEEQLKEQIQEATGTKKKKILRRKGKFRRVGGKKGWLPT